MRDMHYFIDPEDLEQPEPGYLIGTVYFMNVLYHVEGIRVHDEVVDGELLQIANTIDGKDRMKSLVDLCGVGRFHTIELEGMEGNWVFWITPFQS